jgi:two-component system response regulator FlrC
MFDDWLTSVAPLQSVPAAQAMQAQITAQPSLDAQVAVADFERTSAEHLMTTEAGTRALTPDTLNTDLQSATRLSEHQVIMATLASTPSKTEAAKRLGISPRTLRYKMAQLREHGLTMASAC